MERNKTEFTILPAFHGDCILIKTFDAGYNEFIILIDGGTSQTFKYTLKSELEKISRINLLVVTHVDSDHIAGIISLFSSSIIDSITIDEIWINHPEIVALNTGELISTKQGDNLKDLILSKKPGTTITEISTITRSLIRTGIEFIILSPTENINKELYKQWQAAALPTTENDNVNISSQNSAYSQSLKELSLLPFSPDKSIKDDIFNASSISFYLKCIDISILLLADSHPYVIAESLRLNGVSESKKLIADYVKISHHGSLNNTSHDLLGLIQSNNFIISTNGGTANHKHPSRETIARIVFSSSRSEDRINLYFNYKIEDLKQRIGDFINDADLSIGNWGITHKNFF